MAFLKGKRVLSSDEYKLLDDESRARAFTVSGYTSLEVLQEFLDCLTKAAEEGTTKEQFREDMSRFLEEHGYEGLNPWICHPCTGEIEKSPKSYREHTHW